MEYEKCVCPVLNVNGVMATGRQYDLDITLPEDNRAVIYGIIKDCYKDPVCDAVVKLVEVSCECGKEERKPVSHTFTDKNGEFVFGPLCANRLYEIEIWVDQVKHCKVCSKVEREGKCLKGVKLDCKKECNKHCFKDECDKKHEDKCEHKFDDKCKDKCEDKCEDKCHKDCDKKDDKCDRRPERPCRPCYRPF